MNKEIVNDGNIISVSNDYKLPYNKGIGEIIFEKLKENKDLPLQIDGITDEIDTYGSVLQRSIRTALKMRLKGITREDIVTICSHNHLDTNIPIIASLLIGVKTASIDPGLCLSDSIHLLKQIKPKMIFVNEDGIKLIEDTIHEVGIKPEIVVFGQSNRYCEFSEFSESTQKEEEKFVPVEIKDLKETVSILFSSGTSGLAKGVCLSHLSLISLLPSKQKVGNSLGYTNLNYSSPYWISSILMLLYTIVTNSCRLVLPRFEIETFWHSIDKYKVFVSILSPTQLATVANNKKPDNINTSNLKIISVSGSKIHKEQMDRIKQILPTTIIDTRYGQTELGGVCLFFDLATDDIKYIFQKPSSCGRPSSGFTYKIVDLEIEKPLGPNQKGELRIKTEFCMNGYYNLDSSNSWDSDGFLKTGDIAYYDEDYCFYIVDRIKDMLKFQGWQITPAKLESILLSHPAVKTALVIGLPHPVDCDHPTGIVQLNKFIPNVTVEDIQNFFNERIDDDRHRLRGGLRIIDNIPVTPSGKYRKKYLKELILAGSL